MIFAARTLTLALGPGEATVPVEVRIHAPEAAPGRGTVHCVVEIGWPERTLVQSVYGHDGVDAVRMAMLVAGTLLYASAAHAEGRLSWLAPGDGYGFPVPGNMVDMLVGLDKEMFSGAAAFDPFKVDRERYGA